jgi:hypothetical protein
MLLSLHLTGAYSMADSGSDLGPALIGLGGTLIGGIIGFLGGFVSQWLVEGRKEKAEKNKKRAEKLEELVSLLYQHQHWLKVKLQATMGGQDTEEISPFTKAEAITRVYFPELSDITDRVAGAADALETYLIVERSRRAATPGYRIDVDRFSDHYGEYLEPMRGALRDISGFATRELNPPVEPGMLARCSQKLLRGCRETTKRLYHWCRDKIQHWWRAMTSWLASWTSGKRAPRG